MGVSVFEGCDDSCGWIAAILAVLSWGSFGVPIKSSVQLEVNPLVFQSFKTTVCFVTSFLVIFLGEEVRWTHWGIASGLFWVPGATCGIYGIRNAGLAVAVGTWSAINVVTSFVFGIIVFEEKVKDFIATSLAFLCLIVGLVGMSRYSAPQSENTNSPPISDIPHVPLVLGAGRRASERTRVGETRRASEVVLAKAPTITSASITSTLGITPLEIEPFVNNTIDDEDRIMGNDNVDTDKDPGHKDRVVFLGGRMSFSRRQMGVLGAVINGAWGGLSLIPLHYALRDDGLTGASFVISFAGGAVIVNSALWIILYAYHLYHKKGNWREAIDCLPDWHLDQLLIPGLLAGILYSLGNFFSILAVTYLGQGTGYSFCQMQLFVSGLWGVFYFREIKGRKTITKWFLSAAIAILGIISLSYQHEGGTVSHR